MKRLLNDLVINDTKWPDYIKNVKRENNLQSDNKGTCLKWHPFCHQHRTPEGLTSMALLWLLYLQWPYPRWPYLRGSGRVFSSRSLLSVPRLLNKCVTDQFILAIARNEPVCIDYQPGNQEWLWCLLSLWCTRLPSFWYTKPLFLQCALSLQRLLHLSGWISSLQDLLPLLPEHTKKFTRSLKTTKKLRVTWPLDSHSNWITWTIFARVERIQGYY